MPSGKPRKHRGNVGGRPSNKEQFDKQQGQIDQLRKLVSHKNHSTETWHMVDRLLTIIDELEQLSTPIRAATYDGGAGHTAERPILPGVTITETGRIVHGGTYAEGIAKWLRSTVKWAADSAERRLIGKEPDPKPRPPGRPRTSDDVYKTSGVSDGEETYTATG